jgi:hypothetical protein
MYYLIYPAIGSHPKIEISDNDVQNIIYAKNVLSNICSIEEKFDYVVGNYVKLQEEIINKSLLDSIYRNKGINPIFKDIRNINRVLINFLSTAKLYTDQLGTNISRIDKGLKDIIDTEISNIRKTDYSFQISETLRNYMQHCDISTFGSSGFTNKQNENHKEGLIFYYTDILLNITELKKDSKARKTNRRLCNEENNINILDHLKQYFQGLFKIQKKVREILQEERKKSQEIIDTNIEKYSEVYQCLRTSWQKNLAVCEDNKIGFIVEFSRNTLSIIEELEYQNSFLDNIAIRIVSNASKSQVDILKK